MKSTYKFLLTVSLLITYIISLTVLAVPDVIYEKTSYIIDNNPSSIEQEELVMLVAHTDERPRRAIVSLSIEGVDENGYYRNYYELFDPVTKTKIFYVAGNVKVTELNALPQAIETGFVVTLDNGMVDEESFVADDKDEGYLGKIDTSDSSKGLVWLTYFDENSGILSVVPQNATVTACCKNDFANKISGYSFDTTNPDVNFDGKAYSAVDGESSISYKLTENTNICVLEYPEKGEQTTMWGRISNADIDTIIGAKKNFKCYNDKAIDSQGNFTTVYAPYILAYVSATETKSSVPEADYIIIVVNRLEDEGISTNKKDCDIHSTTEDDYSGECGEKLTWTIDMGGVLTISGSGAMKDWSNDIQVPWYRYIESITSVVIEEGVTSIGNYAFKRSKINYINIPESVTYIGKSAFEMSSIKEITIPKGVADIGENTFSHCKTLEKVVLSEGLENIGRDAFSYCEALKDIVLPKSLKSIQSSAFMRCNSLESIVIPDSVTIVGEFAFDSCRSLESVVLSKGLEKIDRHTFDSCIKLADVYMPEGITEICGDAFDGCISLESINIPQNVEILGGFSGCTALKTVSTGSRIKRIGSSAFKGCSSLTEFVLPYGVEYIGNGAFNGCKEITQLILPDTVTFVGSSAFEDCKKLESITLSKNLENLSMYMLEGCSSLKTLMVPVSVKTLHTSMLCSCESFETLYYEGTVSQWNEIDFEEIGFCDELWDYDKEFLGDPSDLGTTGTCGENLTWLINKDRALVISGNGDMTQYRSSREIPWSDYNDLIDKVIIEDGVTSISSLAFMFNDITTLTIGKSLKALDSRAFERSKKLTDIYYNGTWAQWLNIEHYKTQEENFGFETATIHMLKSYLLGDSNDDGNVNVQDIILLAQYCANWDSAKEKAVEEALDTNGDGNVNIQDVILLAQYCANSGVTPG